MAHTNLNKSANTVLTAAEVNKCLAEDGSGNFGIGTSSPSVNLHIEAAGVANKISIGKTSIDSTDNEGITLTANTDNSCYFDTKLATGGQLIFRYGEGAEEGDSNVWLTMDGGNVGIGTSSPTTALYIGRGQANEFMTIDTDSASWYVGIGLSSGDDKFVIGDNASAGRLVIDSSGGMRWPAYGAGTLVTDGSGNITASSDLSKKDIISDYIKGLAEIIQLKPVVFRWKKETGLDIENEYAGFIAQDVEPIIPDAVFGEEGNKTLFERPILAALVNAVKEMNTAYNAKVAEFEKRLSELEGE